jgi:hypothetical protein
MRAIIMAAAILLAGQSFADAPAIKDAEGVIITGLTTEGANFSLQNVVASNCEVHTLSSSQSVSYFCDATSGELSINEAGVVKTSAITKVLIYQSADESGIPTVIYRFKTAWQANIGGFPIDSIAWLVLSNLDAPEGELNGNFTIRRTEQSFPILARWKE